MMNAGRAVFLVSTCLSACGCSNFHRNVAAPVGSASPSTARPNGHVLIRVSAGTYVVGAPHHPRNPQRTVRLKSFLIADAETTNAQFKKFVEATEYVTDAEKRGYGLVSREGMLDWAWDEVRGASWRHPSGPAGPSAEDLPDHPVTQISGADAEAYCKWLGGRLPTLDEWEVAARAGSRSRWPWGDTFDPHKANVWNGTNHVHNTREDGWVYTSPVRSFPPNAWQLYDVIGNVFEYCSDLPRDAALRGASELVAGRGGSWWCSSGTCNYFNLEDIGTMDRHGTLSNQGFRIAFSRQPLSREEK
jgi:sulfatase modifying factor 1